MNKSVLRAVEKLIGSARSTISLADSMISEEPTGKVDSYEWAIYQLVNGAYNMLYGIEKAYCKLIDTLKDEE